MKKFLFVVFFIFAFNVTFAQQENVKEESKSETIKFLKKDGACFKKEFYDLGNVKGVECKVLIITDVVENSKIGCLRLEVRTHIGTLDYNEIDACIKSLEYIKSIIENKPSVYTEIEYVTNDGIEIGAFYSDKYTVVYNQGWNAYVETDNFISGSTEYFAPKNINSLIEILHNAKTLIEEKLKE